MGGYDLYGNYYKSSQDALNAEMAQCNEIDLRLQRSEQVRQENQLYSLQHEIDQLKMIINHLLEENKKLKEKLNVGDQ